MSNVFARFRSLLPQPVEQIGKVVLVGTGVCHIELPGGGVVTARGTAAVNDYVHVRDGVITSHAPAPFGTEHEE